MVMKKHFDLDMIPDMSGKVCIVTGSNTGIGKACAMELASKGAHVIVASRNSSKGQEAVNEIKAKTGNDLIEYLQLDLLSLASVTKFIEEIKAKNLPIHVLINNAGIMANPFTLSEDGIESQFATNHVGHFYLTTQLLPIIKQSAPSRIINVSSNGHRFIHCYGLQLPELNDEKKYSPFFAYGRSKAANILFTRELNQRLEAEGITNVYVNANHPGFVDSDLQRNTSAIVKSILRKLILISSKDGAITQLYLATSPEVERHAIKGKYYIPFGMEKDPHQESSSQENQTALWDYTEALLKEKIPNYPGAGI
ncbi:hypothetical protein K450DRAFT_295543 [Umbelopsis ramanniana AG]|uniref:Uncharacterized protein n=1 Tax=Umbelopsis ramanniana AG TaxID=1314678 RepID=A0AAD5E300_UMBRA|nr:uncharacterized protein K450DRAFT_295543 [Umbelopsis ramanniana AG]KAI8576456.1 hypothetical protein K450DRAFT_295543 [Umbelopsis ramanniana AG]